VNNRPRLHECLPGRATKCHRSRCIFPSSFLSCFRLVRTPQQAISSGSRRAIPLPYTHTLSLSLSASYHHASSDLWDVTLVICVLFGPSFFELTRRLNVRATLVPGLQETENFLELSNSLVVPCVTRTSSPRVSLVEEDKVKSNQRHIPEGPRTRDGVCSEDVESTRGEFESGPSSEIREEIRPRPCVSKNAPLRAS